MEPVKACSFRRLPQPAARLETAASNAMRATCGAEKRDAFMLKPLALGRYGSVMDKSVISTIGLRVFRRAGDAVDAGQPAHQDRLRIIGVGVAIIWLGKRGDGIGLGDVRRHD